MAIFVQTISLVHQIMLSQSVVLSFEKIMIYNLHPLMHVRTQLYTLPFTHYLQIIIIRDGLCCECCTWWIYISGILYTSELNIGIAIFWMCPVILIAFSEFFNLWRFSTMCSSREDYDLDILIILRLLEEIEDNSWVVLLFCTE